MGLPNKDTTTKKAAYHPGLPMKVPPPPLLRIGRDYTAMRKPQALPVTTDTPATKGSESPSRPSPPLLPTTVTSENDSTSPLSDPAESLRSMPRLTTTTPPRLGSSPTGQKTPSPPMLYPIQLPIPLSSSIAMTSAGLPVPPTIAVQTTATSQAVGQIPIFPPLPSNLIPESVLPSEGKSSATRDSKHEKQGANASKLTRKQNVYKLGDDERPYPQHHQERLLMRPWLLERLELQDIPGMIWIDKANNVFQIPWKHGSRREWEHNTDAKLFKMWAHHTGKYRPGQPGSVTDPKTWKANFRCAINSLPDVVEVKEMNVNSKRGPNAFKVYTFLPPKTRKKGKLDSRRLMPAKKEQEMQKQFLDKNAKQNQTPAQPSLPVSQPRPHHVPPANPVVEAPQSRTVIAQAIESVMRTAKLEEEQSSYREMLAAKGIVTRGVELEYSQKVDAPETQTTRTTTPPSSTTADVLNTSIPSTVTSTPTITQVSTLKTKITYNESHIPHKKRKIIDINFPATTSVNVTQTSNLNSILEILNSDESVAKRRKEMYENQVAQMEMVNSQTQKTVVKRFTEDVKDIEIIPKTVTDVDFQKIPTVVFDGDNNDVNDNNNNNRLDHHHHRHNHYGIETLENSPTQQQMNVDVLVRTIHNDSDTVAMMNNGVNRNERQYHPRIDSLARVHKNKEFLKRFLKDNGVRTLIKTKLDEIHRSDVYQSVLKGQPYIPANIEGHLGQNNNKTCSVV